MKHLILIAMLSSIGCSASVDKDKTGDITRVTAENSAIKAQATGREAKVQFCYSLALEQQGEACQSDTTASEKKACMRRMFKDCLKGEN